MPEWLVLLLPRLLLTNWYSKWNRWDANELVTIRQAWEKWYLCVSFVYKIIATSLGLTAHYSPNANCTLRDKVRKRTAAKLYRQFTEKWLETVCWAIGFILWRLHILYNSTSEIVVANMSPHPSKRIQLYDTLNKLCIEIFRRIKKKKSISNPTRLLYSNSKRSLTILCAIR